MTEKYGAFFNKQKENFIKETEAFYAATVNSEVVKSLVKYYDLMKENKLDKEIKEINSILNFSEHDYMKTVESVVSILEEHFEGIQINNDMTLEERIEVLRHFDEFDKHLAEKDLPQVDDLLDVTLTQTEIDNFKDKARYLPQKNMSYKEFLAIEQNYKAVDFERSSFLTASLPCSLILTFLLRRIFKKI